MKMKRFGISLVLAGLAAVAIAAAPSAGAEGVDTTPTSAGGGTQPTEAAAAPTCRRSINRPNVPDLDVAVRHRGGKQATVRTELHVCDSL